jgi:RNA polymerase sigma-70 factor (ECF subfamily)
MGEEMPSSDLVEQFRAGDPQAVAQAFALYSRRLIHLAEQHLSAKLAGRTDGEDVVQSVFRTFFRRCAAGDFHIKNASHLWRLLVQITLLKTKAKARFHTRSVRNAGAEVPGSETWLSEALTQEPGPAEAAALHDQIEVLLHDLPSLYGDVLRMRLEGHSAAEIAPMLNVSRRTVYRALELLRERLLRSAAEGA